MTTSLKKLAALVGRLEAKTAAEELRWSEPFPGMFETKLGGFAIRLSVEYSDFDPERDPDFHITIIQGNQVIDTLSDGELQTYLTSPFLTMKALYSGARRIARKVGSLADDLSLELEKVDDPSVKNSDSAL